MCSWEADILSNSYSNASNTIHVDDLGRNFALNPKEGLKIAAFKDAFTPRAAEDRELDKLARYMVHIAQLQDLRSVDHKVRVGVYFVVSNLPKSDPTLGLEEGCAKLTTGITNN
jgi:hypothetical protein